MEAAGYQLKSDLARVCLPAPGRTVPRRLAWANSISLLFLLIGDRRPHQHTWVPVDLPDARNAISEPNALREDAIRVSLAPDGNVYFRQEKTTPENLSYLIQTALQEGAEHRVYLAADRRAKYADVDAVVGQIRLARVTSIVILAEKPDR